MSDIDDLFAGMKEAKSFGRGTYMEEGLFKVQLKSAAVKKRFKGGHVFIAEFTILESNTDAHKPGTSGSWVPKIEQPNTFGDIKSLMFAALGVDPKTVKQEDDANQTLATNLAKALCGSPSAEAELGAQGVASSDVLGATIVIETKKVKTKEGKDFTRYTFSPAPQSETQTTP